MINKSDFYFDVYMYLLPVVMYGCETWSLTLWEEGSLKVFVNRVSKENIWT
jgi:hypothetical protein